MPRSRKRKISIKGLSMRPPGTASALQRHQASDRLVIGVDMPFRNQSITHNGMPGRGHLPSVFHRDGRADRVAPLGGAEQCEVLIAVQNLTAGENPGRGRSNQPSASSRPELLSQESTKRWSADMRRTCPRRRALIRSMNRRTTSTGLSPPVSWGQGYSI
jgi:hypothetical protein